MHHKCDMCCVMEGIFVVADCLLGIDKVLYANAEPFLIKIEQTQYRD